MKYYMSNGETDGEVDEQDLAEANADLTNEDDDPSESAEESSVPDSLEALDSWDDPVPAKS